MVIFYELRILLARLLRLSNDHGEGIASLPGNSIMTNTKDNGQAIYKPVKDILIKPAMHAWLRPLETF